MLLFGTKSNQRPLPNERQVCPRCMAVTDHAVHEQELRFTIYFIPLFSIRHEVIYTCQQCGDSHVIPYADYLHNHPEPQTDTQPKNGQGPVILNGKLVGDKIQAAFSWRTKFGSDTILKGLYIGLAGMLVLALIVVIVLLPGLIH